MRQARPLEAGERIDIDRAGAQELARLPKVGPRLAKVILADREAQGSFGSLAGLDRVAGIGPGLLKVIAPHAAFSGPAGDPDRVAPLPSANTSLCAAPTSQEPNCPSARLPPAPLNLNKASLTDLDALPGLGPARAAAILRYRQQHGSFASVDELGRVPGLGPAGVAKLREYVAAP
jgi:competence protein ComEA